MISDFGFYLKLLSRRLPWMVLLFVLVTCAGVIMAFRLPTMYTTEATLLVESAQISDVDSGLEIEAAEQLEVIQQRLMTRENLLNIARNARAFPNMSQMSPDQIVDAMREATKINVISGRNKATLMKIGFEGDGPRKVAQVVNAYVSIVLETSSAIRTNAAEGTLSFFEQQVKALSENLDIQSAKIVAFKAENSDALPDNLEYRLGRESLLQERLSRAERDLQSLQAQRSNIELAYEQSGNVTALGSSLSPDQEQLRTLEAELNDALTIYSKTNVRVKTLQSRVDALKQRIDADLLENAGAQPTSGETLSPLDVALFEIDSRIESLRQEIADTNAELASLRDTIERTPANGIALEAMERDLENIRLLYSNAVNRQSDARMSEQVVLLNAGERISVVEAASVPTEPSSPNRPLVMAMGVIAGLGVAGGLFALLEMINTSIRRPADIVRGLEITPLATIPRIESAARKRLRRFNQVVVLLAVVVGVPFILWAVDTYYLPLDLLFDRIKEKLV